MPPRHDFTDLLVQHKKLSIENRDKAVAHAEKTGAKLADVLVDMEFCDPALVARALANQWSLKYANLQKYDIPDNVRTLLDESVARDKLVVPLCKTSSGAIRLGVSDPEDVELIEDLRFQLNTEIEVLVCSKPDIRMALGEIYGDENRHQLEHMSQESIVDADADGLPEPDDDDPDAPIIKLVNLIISEAVVSRASDIHVEPFENVVRVRYRIDGKLIERDSPPRKLMSAILVRIKIMSNIDITEKRRPQDGRMKFSLKGNDYDLRISLLPTNHGQGVVMRILDKGNIKVSVKDLGFAEEDYMRFRRIIKRPNGIFLVTGPTGSGKTTTLYAALNELNDPQRKIITAEDPVEYYLSGINQCQVQTDIGMTFQNIIRAMLRQAPNVILVGEIRDKETADIAIQASLTGHLVFSTLHTNDAPGAVTRLTDMGVAPFLVASSLTAVMAQRLVRFVCSECARPVMPTKKEVSALKLTREMVKAGSPKRGKGCKKCHGTGFRGRRGIFELMTVTNDIRDLTFKQESHTVIRKAARANGMRTLAEDGLRKALLGVTTFSEVIEIAGMDQE